ncbi:DUF1624 domain-containing protein [Planctomycetota bacterium]
MGDSKQLPHKSQRIAAIDWMRGLVMILMMIDHVSMAFDGSHFSADSAALYQPGTQLTAAVFLTRWMTHLCAPTFVFLAGTALALSIERKVARGAEPWSIDRGILTRGLFIAVLDPTLVSLFSWRLTFQVLYAIGVSMMLMALLRRLSTAWLLAISLGWLALGELLVARLWDPTAGNPSIPTALTMAFYYQPFFRISYPLFPWLAFMCLGWAFGRYLTNYKVEEAKQIPPVAVLLLAGLFCMAVFVIVRTLNGYGNMFLLREDSSWIQFLLVSKYPPSLSYAAQQLGLFCLCLAALIGIEKCIGVRKNGVLLVFGQTAMFFYLIHRVVLEGLAQWCGLRGRGEILTTYVVSAIFLIALYPLCRWYRTYKQNHRGGWTRFI